jgi:hypothetical protein
MQRQFVTLMICSGLILFLLLGVFSRNSSANNVIIVKGIIQSIATDGIIVTQTSQSTEAIKNVSVSKSKNTVIQNEKGKTIPFASLAIGVPVLVKGRYLEDKSVRANLIKIISREELEKEK